VLVSSTEERDLLHRQSLVQSTLQLGREADVAFVGIGELGADAPLCLDGFLDPEEMARLMEGGAAGEICGWMFDRDGRLLEGSINGRVASVPLPLRETTTVIGLAKGRRKYRALLAALRGGMINGVISGETAARYLLSA